MDWTFDDTRAEMPHGPPTDPSHESSVVAIVEEYDDAPDECTLYPDSSSEMEVTTRWITAQGEAFVELRARR